MKLLLAPWLWFFLLLSPVIKAEDIPAIRWEIIAVGDIMLGRGVATKIEKHGLSYPFSQIRLVTDSLQLLVGNLESVLSSSAFKSQSPYRFKANPVLTANILKQNGFGFLSVANNHAYDCGIAGLQESCRILDSLKIQYGGVYEKQRLPADNDFQDSAKTTMISRPAFIDIDGIRVGFLAFCQPYLINTAGEDTIIAPADSAVIFNSIHAIRDSCQVIIASFHWGYEYQQQPSRAQKYLGRLAIRSGAKIVHGHHPHVLQGIEFYRDGVIAYSLGNFIFDQKDSLANQSAVLHMIMKGSSIDSVWLQPIEIKGKRPAEASKGNFAKFKRSIDGLNKSFKTKSLVADHRIYLHP